MPKKDTFMLVSLQESQAKQLATVLANDKSRLILDYLAKHSKATESSLAKKLRIPLSTVHYNLQQLVKGRLVTAEEFHYSRKGREVNHYSLANKYIIIAPKPIWNLREKLAQVLPMVTVAGGIAFWIQQKFGTILAPALQAMPEAAKVAPQAAQVIQEAAQAAPQAAYDAFQMADVESLSAAPAMIQETVTQPALQSVPIGWYFFAGFLLAIVFYLAYDYYKTRR